jgi:hypothetical protein
MRVNAFPPGVRLGHPSSVLKTTGFELLGSSPGYVARGLTGVAVVGERRLTSASLAGVLRSLVSTILAVLLRPV